MTNTPSDTVKFDGEEAGAGYASPFLDMIATGFILVLTVVVMVASFGLPVPGGMATAPGLLPFMTAASLFIMALILGFTAYRRRQAGEDMAAEEMRDLAEDKRALGLALAVGVYIACLQYLAFQHYVTLAGFQYVFSAFEPVTIVALTAIITLYWRGPLWVTLTISTGWTFVLSLVFQKVFTIPLPGGF